MQSCVDKAINSVKITRHIKSSNNYSCKTTREKRCINDVSVSELNESSSGESFIHINSRRKDYNVTQCNEPKNNKTRIIKSSRVKEENQDGNIKENTLNHEQLGLPLSKSHESNNIVTNRKVTGTDIIPEETVSTDCITAEQMQTLPEDIRAILQKLSKCTSETAKNQPGDLENAYDSTRRALSKLQLTTDANKDNVHVSNQKTSGNAPKIYITLNDSKTDDGMNNRKNNNNKIEKQKRTNFPTKIFPIYRFDNKRNPRLLYGNYQMGTSLPSKSKVDEDYIHPEKEKVFTNNEIFYDRPSTANNRMIISNEGYEKKINANASSNDWQTIELYSRAPKLSEHSSSNSISDDKFDTKKRIYPLTTLERERLQDLKISSTSSEDIFTSESNHTACTPGNSQIYFSKMSKGSASSLFDSKCSRKQDNITDESNLSEYDNSQSRYNSYEHIVSDSGSVYNSNKYEHSEYINKQANNSVDRFERYIENAVNSCSDSNYSTSEDSDEYESQNDDDSAFETSDLCYYANEPYSAEVNNSDVQDVAIYTNNGSEHSISCSKSLYSEENIHQVNKSSDKTLAMQSRYDKDREECGYISRRVPSSIMESREVFGGRKGYNEQNDHRLPVNRISRHEYDMRDQPRKRNTRNYENDMNKNYATKMNVYDKQYLEDGGWARKNNSERNFSSRFQRI